MNQEEYYKSLVKTDIFSHPHNYPWNALLYYVQFTQSELLMVKSFIDIRNMIKYQRCLTRSFVVEHFTEMIDEDDLLTWETVYIHVLVE